MEPVVYTPVSAAANLRRSIVISTCLGVAALVATTIAGHPLMGMFACVGLALGAVNTRILQRSVIRHATAGSTKRQFRGGVMGRLGVITVLAILAALIVRPDGLAVVAGLAVFQVLMLVGAAVPVLRSLRPTS